MSEESNARVSNAALDFSEQWEYRMVRAEPLRLYDLNYLGSLGFELVTCVISEGVSYLVYKRRKDVGAKDAAYWAVKEQSITGPR